MLGASVLLVLVGLVALGVWGLLQLRGRGRPGHDARPGSTGQSVRRFFQFLLLLGLLFAAASGVSGLLSRLVPAEETRVGYSTSSELALELSLTLIALPLWVALAVWTARSQRRDPAEARTGGWTAYLTLAGLLALVMALTGWHRTISPLLGPDRWQADALGQAVVWSGVWAGHRAWGRRTAPARHLRPLVLLSTLIGLAVASTGLAMLLGGALRGLLMGERMVASQQDIAQGALLLAVGGVAWAVHWFVDLRPGPRDPGWLTLVLLAGVGGGLLAAVVAASLLGYDVLVWLVGEPGQTEAERHFSGAPGMISVVVVGLLVWWYHREALEPLRAAGRTEVRRVYEYLLSAIGLLAAGGGVVMVLVTIVEALAAGPDLVVGGDAINALLAALVLLCVGLPLWWRHWAQAQRARGAQALEEVSSPTRRIYLLVLFGVMGVVAVVALITLVYLVLQDVLDGGADVETLRRVRFALGLLMTTGLLAGYHWWVFRGDRQLVPEAATGQEGWRQRAAGAPVTSDDAGTTVSGRGAGAQPGISPGALRSVLLVGSADAWTVAELARLTGAEVRVLQRADVDLPGRSAAELADLARAAGAPDVVLVDGPQGASAVPVRH